MTHVLRWAIWLGLFTIWSFAQTPGGTNGAIAGRITLAGKPAPQVLVLAVENINNNPQVLARAVTDDDGQYRLTNLVPGNYGVQPYAGAYVSSGERNFYGARKTVTLKAGETVSEVDFTLTRGGVITGRVTDAEGKPVIAQRINLARVTEKRDENIFSFNFITDDRGIYRIYGLEAGRYVVSAGRDQEQQTFGASSRFFYPQTFHPNVADRKEATLVEVTAGGENSNIDIRLSPAVETFTASGRVVDADTGQPAEGATIAYGRLTKGELNGFGSENRPTGKDGHFLLQGLSAGEYAAFLWVYGKPTPNYSDTLRFTITDSDLTDLEIKQRRGSVVQGTLRLDNGSVLPEGARWPGLQLVPVQRKNSEPYTNATVTPAPDGAFTFTGVRPGQTRLILDYPAMEQGFTLLSVTHNGLDITKDGLEIVSGQDVTGAQGVIAYGACTLAGQVSYTNGTPDEKARVSLSLRRRDWPATARPRLGELDTRGSFTIRNLTAGEYTASLSIYSANAPHNLKPQTVTVTCPVSNATLTFDLAPNEGGRP